MSSIDVDEKVLARIFDEVRLQEGNNLKTGEFSDRDMIKKIINIIDKEAQQRGANNEI